MPEDLREHYESLYKVNFQSQMDQAMQRKEQGFAKIAFKSKKIVGAASGPAPASFGANAAMIPAEQDKKVGAAA